MDLFSDAQVCSTVDNGTVCNITYNLTHSERFAVASDWLIGKPLAILGLVLIAALARWLLHRLIERLADRAGEGVELPHFNRRRPDSRRGAVPIGESVAAARRIQRAKTMASLLKSIVTASIVGDRGDHGDRRAGLQRRRR